MDDYYRLRWKPHLDSLILSFHKCNEVPISRSIYDIHVIAQFEQGWFLVTDVYANEKDFENGEAKYVGEYQCGNGIHVLFCPYCGQKLNSEFEIKGDGNE